MNLNYVKKIKIDNMEIEVENKDLEVPKQPIESRKEYKKIIRLEVEDISCFKLMVEYLYMGTLIVHQDLLVPLLSIAIEYNLDPLIDSCSTVLGKNINQDNVFSLLEVVNRFQVSSLRVYISDFLANNFQQLLHTGILLQLDMETWKMLVQSDDLNADMEEQVFFAVMSYSEQFTGQQNQDILKELLPYIRFALMDPKSIVDIEEKPSLKNIPVLQQLIFEAYRYKAHPTSKSSLRTEPRRGMRKLLELQNEYDNKKGKTRWH